MLQKFLVFRAESAKRNIDDISANPKNDTNFCNVVNIAPDSVKGQNVTNAKSNLKIDSNPGSSLHRKP